MISRLALALPLLLAVSEYIPRTVKDPAGRYFGVKQLGTDPQAYDSLELVIDSRGGATLTWVQGIFFAGRRRDLELSALKVDEASVSMTVKGDRPPGLPAQLVGRFVTKVPPPNAKGPVEAGILFQGDWFLKDKRE